MLLCIVLLIGNYATEHQPKYYIYFSMCSPGKNSQFVERVVPPRPLPQPVQETPPGPGHGTHAHTGRQLVQEPPSKRPRCIRKEQVSQK